MEAEFWHERWRRNEIAFHQGRANARLTAWFDRLGTAPGATILVPLCGKSHDMRWLLECDRRVLGVELSPVAVEAFFTEYGIAFECQSEGAFRRYRGGRAEILCGDFFDLTPRELQGVDAVYDRAAIVALPEAMRARYVRHLLATLPPSVPILLVALEFPDGEMEGPPFSVTEEEVRGHFGDACAVECLASHEILEQEPGLRRRGLSRLGEHAFLIGPRAAR